MTALLRRPHGWLANGVSTAFPAATKLRHVTISDSTATIDLGGSAGHASQAALSDMTSQLAWALAGPSGGQSGIRSVNLEINGHMRTVGHVARRPERPFRALRARGAC